MAASVGAVVAQGSRSTVHELGTDAVAKVPLPDTAEAWIRDEAEYSRAARLAGAPVPEFLGFIDHEGRTASVYQRARGPVMWDAVREPSGERVELRNGAPGGRQWARTVPQAGTSADRPRADPAGP